MPSKLEEWLKPLVQEVGHELEAATDLDGDFRVVVKYARAAYDQAVRDCAETSKEDEPSAAVDALPEADPEDDEAMLAHLDHWYPWAKVPEWVRGLLRALEKAEGRDAE